MSSQKLQDSYGKISNLIDAIHTTPWAVDHTFTDCCSGLLGDWRRLLLSRVMAHDGPPDHEPRCQSHHKPAGCAENHGSLSADDGQATCGSDCGANSDQGPYVQQVVPQ